MQFELARVLGNWDHERGEGGVYGESGFILSDDPATVRGPDLAVVLRPHAGQDEPGQWIRGAPDLAVEVLSPADASSAIHRKVLEYLDAGARLVWIVDPEARTVAVYRPDGTASLLKEPDVLGGEDVLAGFQLPLTELF